MFSKLFNNNDNTEIRQINKRKRSLSIQKSPIKTRKQIRSSPKIHSPETKKRILATRKLTQSRKLILQSKLTLNPSLRYSNYLKMICSDYCGCLVFARENEKVKKLFDYFVNFNFASKKNPNAKMVGKASANGFVYEIALNKNGYESNVLLKSSIRKDSDNLYYEYLVGINFVNKMNNIFPCFTETYQILINDSNELKTQMINGKSIPVEKINKHFRVLDMDITEGIKNSCKHSDQLALLVQYIKNPITLKDYILRIDKTVIQKYSDALNNLTYILYQIYGPLSQMKNIYTHYDLHLDNVLLYKLKFGHFVTMKYIYKTTTITFKTNLIAKIIDYGRSYFSSQTIDSKEILAKMRQERTCKVEKKNTDILGEDSKYPTDSEKTLTLDFWGSEHGYYFLRNEDPYQSNFITSSKPNISHDLRLAKMVSSYINDDSKLGKLLKKVVYKFVHGTPELIRSQEHNGICNVSDMELALKNMILENAFSQTNNNNYLNDNCIGELTIYMDEDKEMDFVSFT